MRGGGCGRQGDDHVLTRGQIVAALKRARYDDDERALFCLSDAELAQVDYNDCGCCLDGGLYEERCGCPCHARVERLAERVADLLLGRASAG